MKNEMTRYMLKEHFKSSVIISAVIAGAVSLVFIIVALVIGETDDKTGLNNFVTMILLFWGGFVTTAAIGINGINMGIYMNCSRKATIKAVFTTIILISVVTSAIALAAEGLIAGISHTTGLGYVFKPLIIAGKSEAFEITFINTVLSYGFNVLLFYAVSAASLFLISASMKFGKWVWIGWWVIYMLLITLGKTIVKAVGSFAKQTFGSTAGAALVTIITAAVVFTLVDILLIRKIQLRKSALMWTSAARKA